MNAFTKERETEVERLEGDNEAVIPSVRNLCPQDDMHGVQYMYFSNNSREQPCESCDTWDTNRLVTQIVTQEGLVNK